MFFFFFFPNSGLKWWVLVVLGWEVHVYADALTCSFLLKGLHDHSSRFPTSFMCCPWLVLESCEVWLKLAGELMFPVPHHTIKRSKCLKGEDAPSPDRSVTADGLKNLGRLLEKGKRKCVVKRWDRKPRPWQEGEGYDSCSRAAQTDVLRQPCGGSWDVAHHSGLTPALAWFKRIVVVGDGSKSKPAIKGEGFGQWLGNIIPLDERRVQPASLWAGVSETNSLSYF